MSHFTSWETLCAYLELDPSQTKQVIKKAPFPLLLPKRLAEKIEKGRLDDPILRQFVPLQEELETHPQFHTDPVGDLCARRAPKCLHKYQGRVLLVTSPACAMHCRYCFRQNFEYAPQNQDFEEEIAYITNDPTIHEVILSGGDPLSLSDPKLGRLISALQAISHVKRLRFHSRYPIGVPERINAPFLKILEETSLQTWFVIHCNHPRELDAAVIDALKKIQRLGIPVLNQAVLLKGVNDTVETLQALCEKLVDHGIQPYYLHQIDRVQGAAHFEVGQAVGERLIEELRKRISGYAVPTYVREISGEPSKAPIKC